MNGVIASTTPIGTRSKWPRRCSPPGKLVEGDGLTEQALGLFAGDRQGVDAAFGLAPGLLMVFDPSRAMVTAKSSRLSATIAAVLSRICDRS